MVAHTRTNLYHTPVMEYFELLTDWRGARWAEAYFNDNEIVMYQKSRRDSVFFVGALQIDAFGNSNLIGLGPRSIGSSPCAAPAPSPPPPMRPMCAGSISS